MKLGVVLLSVLISMVLGPAYAAPVSQSTSTVPGGELQETLVPEPVFGGTAYIVEAGRHHSRSIILVHGMGDRASRDWETTIPVLSKQYHVIAFDLPGFGRSAKGNHLYSPSHYARFIDWVAAAYARKPFTLIGHSMGGAIALRYAADYPESIDELVLVDAAGILYYVSLSKELYRLNSANPEKKPGKEELDSFVRFMLDTASTVSSSDGAKKVEPALKNDALRKMAFGGDPKKISGTALILENYGPAVDAIRTPTLLIWGEKDRIAPPRTARALAARIHGARMKIIPDAGHVPMLEHPDLFHEILLEELGSPSPARHEDTPAREQPGADRAVRYVRQKGLVLTGSYSKIELNGCSDIRIVDATAGEIVIRNSDAVLENVVIIGKETGIVATKALITGTNVKIEADTAIHASRSRLDLAGADITGRKTAAATNSSAVLMFSISRVQSPSYTGPLHGYRKISRRTPF